MKLASTLLAAGLLASTGAAVAADFSDTFIGVRQGNAFSEPGISPDVPKTIWQLGHFSAYRYGSNFFNVDLLRSRDNDPANGGGAQAQELYAVYRHALSLSKVTGTKFEYGLVRDLSITAGFDAGAKDTAFAPKPLKLVLGPTVTLGIPNGFLDLNLSLYNETNNNGIVGRKVSFDDTWQLNAVWATGLQLGLPATFKGFLAVTGAKGTDGFGAETKTETLLRAALLWDVGTAAGLKKGTVLAGVGYEYWRNKFGNDESVVPGSKTSAPTLNAEWHF